MHECTRACIAYIAGTLVNNASSGEIYDYSQEKYVKFSGSVKRNHVCILDHERGTYITGAISNLYDFYRGSSVSLSVKGNKIHGHDYGDRHEYGGIIDGNRVNIHYDDKVFSYVLA